MLAPAKVIAIALDAADPGLVRELVAAGEMPALARLLENGATVDTLAPEGVYVSANWPTLFTATRPDRHGYLCWEEIPGGSYERRMTEPSELVGVPFWERLSDAGRRVAVFDVPHTMVRPLNGVMVSEWGCHDRHFGTASHPEGLADELSAAHGRHFGSCAPPGTNQFAPCDYTHRDDAHRTETESAALLDEILKGLEQKRAASLDLLDRGGWDVFLTVLGESHCVGHQLWHLHEPEHPAHDPSLTRQMGGDPMRTVYRRLDSVVADHLARLGPDDTAYVLMPHGMTAHHDGTHLFDQVLHRLDWALDDPTGLGAATRAAASAARLVPAALRRPALRAAAPIVRSRLGEGHEDVLPPPEERRWFMAPNNTVVGAVRLNLAGREPRGRIHPEDRREVLGWIARRLRELVNLDTGGQVVRECIVADDVYRRTPGDAMPDLFIEWERSAPIERVWSPATGTVVVPYTHWRQGDHVREGLMIASGPGIEGGRRRGAYGTEHVGATISAAAGLRLTGVDGQPIESVLPRAARASRPGLASRAHAALAGRVRTAPPRWAGRDEAPLVAALRDVQTLDSAHKQQQAELAELSDRLERHMHVTAMAAWLPGADVPEDVLVSVVMPTRNRRTLLEHAIASVERQSYTRWELLVVDDASDDDTADFLSAIEDPRVRALASDGSGCCRARNVGLDAAHGEIVTYLDDDNRYDPHWLRAVVHTFASNPDASVCYGARVFDDESAMFPGPRNGRPGMHFNRWDRGVLLTSNIADQNVLAHRRGSLRFDEDLVCYGDWDLLLRLTETEDPVEVPAVAVYYRTGAPDRLSQLPGSQLEQDFAKVRRKHEPQPS